MRLCPQCGTACDAQHKFCPACGFPIGKVAASADDPLIGRTLPGGYVILELVGIGGMGRVYRAEQTTLGRTVAVKIIHPHLVGEENAAARFITEARASSRLNHPNSVAIIDFGKTPDGQLYLVMEFLRGKDLARVTYEEGPLSFRRIVDLLRQVLAALAEAHHLEIIHRDLKPENIILEPMRQGGDFVKVVDFGLAKMKEGEKPSITSPGIVCGTPEYMSPEQGRGDPLDARSDLYAVGVIFYQLLTGKLPFEAESPTQVVLQHLTQPPPDPRKIAPERQISDALVDVLMKALEKDQNKRYASADDLANAMLEAVTPYDDRLSLRSPVGLQLVRCGQCGAMNAAAQKFCGECGAATTSTQMVTVAAEGGEPAESTLQGPAPQLYKQPAPNSLPYERPPRSGPTSQQPGRARFPLPLMAREDDLAWLEDRRNDAKTSLTGARIVGDIGMGKSRLLREFLEVCAAAGDSVVETGPDPTWAEVGYYALRKAIRQLAQLPADGGSARDWSGASVEARRGLSDIFSKGPAPVLLSMPPGGAGGISPEERRFAAAEALRWALVIAGEKSKGHRVILAVDDLQQVDGASRNAFADAIGEPPLVGALLVVAYTAGFDPGWSANAAAARVLTGLPTAVVAKVFAQSQSNHPSLGGARAVSPMYLEQLVRYLREQGGGAPARLADLIALRVERLPTDARRVLQALAVWGDDANDSSLMPLLPEDTDLVEALGFLRRGGMVQITDSGFRTSHPLIRDIALATIPAAVRKELHAKAAGVCEAQGSPLEVRALHQFFASNAFQALILLEKLSGECGARGDTAGTILALRRGLELARRELFRGELDDPERAVLIFSRKLGEALAKGGSFTDAEGVLREALDLAGPNGQDRARVLGALAHVAHGRDHRTEAKRYLREALELAHRSGAHELVSSLEDLRRSFAV
jgi:serine/threonine protein kinase